MTKCRPCGIGRLGAGPCGSRMRDTAMLTAGKQRPEHADRADAAGSRQVQHQRQPADRGGAALAMVSRRGR